MDLFVIGSQPAREGNYSKIFAWKKKEKIIKDFYTKRDVHQKKKETYFISLSKSLHQINNLVFSNLWMEKHCYGILFVINILYFANPSTIIMFRAGIFILPVCPYTPPSRTLLECLLPDDNIWYLCSSMWKPTDFLFLTSLAAWKAIVMLGSEGELWLSPAARTGRSSQVGRDERRMRWGVRCLSSYVFQWVKLNDIPGRQVNFPQATIVSVL